MRLPAAAKWVGLALLGLAIAVAVAIAASRLTSQQIGIASESVRAGDALVPPSVVAHQHRRARHRPHRSKPQGETTAESPPPTPPP